MFYFSINPKLKFVWPTEYLVFLRQLIQYLQVNSILAEGK